MARRDLDDVVDRRDLRDAHAGDDARRADPGRADPDLDGVRTGVDQRLGRLAGGDVAGDELELALETADAADHLDHAARVAVRGVDDEHVCARRDQSLRALEGVGPDPDGGADAQATLGILRRARELDPLRDVFDGDQPAQATVLVDDRQLLDPVPVEQRLGLAQRRPDGRGDEIACGHQRRDGLGVVALETQVAVREDADEAPFAVGDRHTRDVVARHQRERVLDQRVGRERDRLADHARPPSA